MEGLGVQASRNHNSLVLCFGYSGPILRRILNRRHERLLFNKSGIWSMKTYNHGRALGGHTSSLAAEILEEHV